MNCQDARNLFSLYYDSEGDAELHLQIGDHLAKCPECKAWFNRRMVGEGALADLLAKGTYDAEMWQRIEQQARERAMLNRPAGTAPSRRTWLLALAAAFLAAVGFWRVVVQPSSDGHGDPMARLAAVEHENYLRGRWKAEIVSNSVEELETQLRSKAGFQVRCPPQGQAGFQLQGGGVCRLDRQLSAHVVGLVDKMPISIFVLPPESLAQFPHMQQVLQQEGSMHTCREGEYEMVAARLHGHIVLAMGQIDNRVLIEILRGYGNYHPQPSAI